MCNLLLICHLKYNLTWLESYGPRFRTHETTPWAIGSWDPNRCEMAGLAESSLENCI